MAEHPIEGLMDTAMENIKEMVDVNTIVGDPVETIDGSVIIPISKVSFGFAAGGGEYNEHHQQETSPENKNDKPFGGGSGGGVMLQPVAFLVVGQEKVKLLPVDNNAVIERLINAAPDLLKELKSGSQKQGPDYHN
ncbi:GerW family sporulation protein [Fuchsiella alkaliacetigena]|uniref:GerW family sporulation protein n=1 Tax=Fuchsiella alkaliacetigena TaxID=957042 RepID=UPI00200A5AE6|nr:GerW family sporulation protein [Fuchsiella alkaliacetigena]MCK8825726.1 GerW family sporulation protein [Fuchsiella alkaliacetigena]